MFKISRHEVVNKLCNVSKCKILFTLAYWLAWPYHKVIRFKTWRRINKRLAELDELDLTDEEWTERAADVYFEEMGGNPELKDAFKYIVNRELNE